MDNIFFTRFARQTDSAETVEAALKFHSMTSSSVVLPADQLRFPETCRVLNQQPKLVSRGVVKFVIGSDKRGILEYLEEKAGDVNASAKDLIQLIEQTPEALQTYQQPATFLTFNKLFWQQIAEPSSFARQHGVISQQDCETLLAERSSAGIKGRALYEFIDQTYANEKRLFLRDLAEYIYLYAGAKHTGSRLILPQQELIDWSDTAIIPHQEDLSEWSLFFNVLIENIVLLADDLSDLEHMGLVQETNFIKLSYDDIYALRDGINFSAFVNRYVEIIDRCDQVTGSNEQEDIFRSIEEILTLRENLISTFERESKSDVAAYRMLKGAEGFVAFFGSVLGLSYGIRALLNSFAVVMKREKEFKAWQSRRLKRLQEASAWGRDRISGGNIIPFLKDVERRIMANLASG